MAEEIELEDIGDSGENDSQNSSIDDDSSNPDMRCVICLESEPPFVRPCNCATYHPDCLRQEIQQCGRSRCAACNQPYRGLTITPATIRTDSGVFGGFRSEIFRLYRSWATYIILFLFINVLPLVYLFQEWIGGAFILSYLLVLHICFILHAIYRWRHRVNNFVPEFREEPFNHIDINLPLIRHEREIYKFDDDTDDGGSDAEGTAADTAFSVDTDVTGTGTDNDFDATDDGSDYDQVAIDIPMEDPNAQVVINIFDDHSTPEPPESTDGDSSSLRRRTGTFTGDDE